MNVDYVNFYIQDTDIQTPGQYYVDFETRVVSSKSQLLQMNFEYSNTITLTAFKTDRNAPTKSDGSLDCFVQKRVVVEATPAVYTFKLVNEDGSVTSDDVNSLKIPKGTSQWKVYVSDKGTERPDLTRYYIESELEPTIVVSNSSMDVKIVATAEDHWVLETVTDPSKNPVSAVIQMELFTWNVLLNPVSLTFSMTTQVFQDSEYYEGTVELPDEWVDISPVSISPNSAVFAYDGALYMTDDAYTTWRKLNMKYTEVDGGTDAKPLEKVTDCTFSSLVFAIVMNNRVYWRNFFVDDTFSPIEDFPKNVENVRLYSRLFDNIPRNQNTSGKYSTGAPVYGSFSNNTGWYIFRYNGTLEVLGISGSGSKITEVKYAGAINCVDTCIALVTTESGSELRSLNFFTGSLEIVHKFQQAVEQLVINPLTESIVVFMDTSVMISYDGGYNYLTIGTMKAKIRSFAFRHTTDEIYIVDELMNLYIIFSELHTMQLIESYTGIDCFIAVSSDDSVYLMTKKIPGLKTIAIPIDTYISSFVYNDFESDVDPLLTVSGVSYPYYDISIENYTNTYYTGLSIYGDSEECRYDYQQVRCRDLISGQFLFESRTVTGTLELDTTQKTGTFAQTTDFIFTQDNVQMTLIFEDLALITRVTAVDDTQKNVTFAVVGTNGVTQSDSGEREYLIRLIDTRALQIKNGLSVTVGAQDQNLGYRITCANPDFDLTDGKVGMMLETTDGTASCIITAFEDADTAYCAVTTGTTLTTGSFAFKPPTDAKFKVDPVRKRPWSIRFANCNGDVVSPGTADYHQLMYIMQLHRDSPVEFSLELPSEGVVKTRYSNPEIMTTYSRSSSEWINNTYYLAQENEWEPFTKVVSAFCGGSPKCKYLSIVGLTDQCLANRRLKIIDEEVRDYHELSVNYRPPSDLGNKIATSVHAYNRDPQNTKMDKDFTKLSSQQKLSVPNMCKVATTRAQCHCERADLALMDIENSDCFDSVPEFIFLKGWQPRVAIEEYINGEWIVIDDNPTVELMDMNDRTVFCVDHVCASSDRRSLTYSNGQTIYFRGIELFHLRFKVIGECEYAAYQMAYIVNPPMLRTEVYLSQMITAVVFGLVMAILVCCNADKLSP